MYFTLLYVAAEIIATFATVNNAIKPKNRNAAVPLGIGMLRTPPSRLEERQTPIGMANSPAKKAAGNTRKTMRP
jgi:hypothetical protein